MDKFINDLGGVAAERQTHREHEVMGPFTLETRHTLLNCLLGIEKDLQKTLPDITLISPEEIKAIELLWMYDGDTINSYDSIHDNESDTIDDLIDRLMKVEGDMSDLSKRVGVYKKLEQVIMEYAMNKMVIDSESATGSPDDIKTGEDIIDN